MSLSPQEIQTVMNQWNTWFDQLTQQGKIKEAKRKVLKKRRR
jgi:hypothetical protein